MERNPVKAKQWSHSFIFYFFLLVAWVTLSPQALALGPSELAVIINESDDLSVQIGEYYAIQRNIPKENVIRIKFPPGNVRMTKEDFAVIKGQVDQATPTNVQAFALTWALPFSVDCMSITTAFAMGYDPKFCSQGCQETRLSPYFNSASSQPQTDFKIRPTMSIAATSYQQAVSLIQKGIASDNTHPLGTGYLVGTSDIARNVRARFYPNLINQLSNWNFTFKMVETDALTNEEDVFSYFTGQINVDSLDTLNFLPGAIADHLTSTGGILNGTSQMSALRWLEAGATGSYGTVAEPCNYTQKFPDPTVAMNHYLNGDTLIEAYWKSVAWPG